MPGLERPFIPPNNQNKDLKKDDFYDLYKTNIENEDDFWKLFHDCLVQFNQHRILLNAEDLEDKDFESFHNSHHYLDFNEYYKEELPLKFKENKKVKMLIGQYNLVSKLMNEAKTRKEFAKAFENVQELTGYFPLGIDKNEEELISQAQINLIEGRPQFNERINDIRSEMSGIKNAVDRGLTFEKIRENLDENPVHDFYRCLSNFHQKLSLVIENDEEYKEIILIANDFVRRINEVGDMDELKNILKEQEDYFKIIKNV